MKTILFIAGTRPECIKIAPVYSVFKKSKFFHVLLCVTGQQRELLRQALGVFDMEPDFDLDIMSSNQALEQVTSRVLLGVRSVLEDVSPDLVLVHGDTTTCFAASLAAFYQKITVGHIEAGLRTEDILSPWPEELNRRMTSKIASLHFAPTEQAALNLIAEGVNQSTVLVTGNTVIDSLLSVKRLLEIKKELAHNGESLLADVSTNKKIILVTGHRRENFGEGFDQICNAINDLSRREDVQIVFAIHLNPNVKDVIEKNLAFNKNILLIEPQDYVSFVYLMVRSHLILTDSGGVQEEAPSLGKPVLVMRNETERPEGIDAGTAILTGPNQTSIITEVNRLLDDPKCYNDVAVAKNPYGDGLASEKILQRVKDHFNISD